MGDDHIDWVAQYLVMKRASIEPNFHTLYISFMDTLGSAQLRKTVLRETYRNIKVHNTKINVHVYHSSGNFCVKKLIKFHVKIFFVGMTPYRIIFSVNSAC